MQQYTTEWAKEYLREHENVIAISQDESGEVFVYELLITDNHKEWYTSPDYIETMLEHPDGWKNSKVTREDLCD